MEQPENTFIWRGLYYTTKKFMWVFLLIAVMCFLSAWALANQLSNVDFTSFTLKNLDAVGCIASAIVAVACSLVAQSHKSDDLSKMTTAEKSTHAAALKKVRLALIVFFLMFGGFFVTVSFRQQEIGNFGVLSCLAFGVVFLGLSVLACKMANQNKTTYLNPRSSN